MAASLEATPAFEGVVVVKRWRRLGRKFLFVDVVGAVAEGAAAEEWQLCLSRAVVCKNDEAHFAVDYDASGGSAASSGGAVRACIRAVREHAPSRRGLASYRCEAMALIIDEAPADDSQRLSEAAVDAKDGPRADAKDDGPCADDAGRARTGAGARSSAGGGRSDILCKFWARGEKCPVRRKATRSPDAAEGCPYRHAFAADDEKNWATGARQRQVCAKLDAVDGDDPHAPADKRGHAARHSVLAQWLVAVVGLDVLRRGPVVDVAGGRGSVAWVLQCEFGIECVTLDPRAPKPLCARRRKLVRRRGLLLGENPDADTLLRATAPAFVCASLDEAFEATFAGGALLASCSAIVGLHADEATEAIVDAGLKYGKPFAVVPCCVFSELFPNRRIATPPLSLPVLTHKQLCDYLIRKDAGIETAFLQLGGKNKVVFRRVASPPDAGLRLAQPAVQGWLPASVKQHLRRHPDWYDASETEADDDASEDALSAPLVEGDPS
ncbi:hypothetical protein M885DRAFT_456264 [Pelagophyceae sp. CCMP2097]|nr:hypothetical protein M885DRAFT_456264 [Pelagophyceae sp. CCMP2097]